MNSAFPSLLWMNSALLATTYWRTLFSSSFFFYLSLVFPFLIIIFHDCFLAFNTFLFSKSPQKELSMFSTSDFSPLILEPTPISVFSSRIHSFSCLLNISSLGYLIGISNLTCANSSWCFSSQIFVRVHVPPYPSSYLDFFFSLTFYTSKYKWTLSPASMKSVTAELPVFFMAVSPAPATYEDYKCLLN